MRINGSGNRPIDGGRTRAPKGTPGHDREPNTPAAVVSLGEAASIAKTSRVDAAVRARLEAVRAALDRGEYSVDLDRLAGKIMDDELVRAQ